MQFIQSSILFSFLMFAYFSTAQTEDQRIVSSDYEFKKGSTEYLYGDNVVFRAAPSASAKAIDTLSIGSKIKIIRKTEETMVLNGLDWNWYEVKVGRKTGFILAGLIALDRVLYDDVIYLVTVAGIKMITEDSEYLDYKVRTRVLLANNEFYGHETALNANLFYIEAFGNRGLDGIENMLCIHLYAPACGLYGGEIYLFNNGDRLFKGIGLTTVADGGVFWFSESVVFPEDENGDDGVLIYERENGVAMNDEMNWTRATVHRLILKWENEQFTPNIEEFEFGEDE